MKSKTENKEQRNIEREIAELETGLTELGIDFDDTVLERFKMYLEILHSYRVTLHLVSHGDYDRISRRHFLPSLVAFPYVKKHGRFCDVGAGAGFPSVPLKIFLPDLDLVIFEAQRKKASFLHHLVSELDLSGIEIINDRAEHYSGQRFDLVLLKAVGKIHRLVGVVDTLLLGGGEAIFYKTHRVDEEIERAEKKLREKRFRVEVKKTITPVEKSPIALVILSKL
jgi:16S rRNA (guanine527-N7)-methyltransferase